MRLIGAAILLVSTWASLDRDVSPSRWVLVYTGGPNRPAYTVDDLLHLTSVVDTAGRPVGPLCDGVILTEFHAVSGRYYMPWPNGQPSTGADWERYIDSVTSPTGVIFRLDSAAVRSKVSFVVMVPYPDTSQHAFIFRGRSYDLGKGPQRVAVAEAYLNDMKEKIQSLRLPHLSFYGFYWLDERVNDNDSSLVSQVTAAAHSMGYRFLWIPYFTARGALRWRAFGFDEAWLQPNYFFHPDVSIARFDTALTRARSAGMGLELEFDKRLFTDSLFRDRLGPYLTAFEGASDLRNRSIAIYEGQGALIQLSRSSDVSHRALYRRLVAVLRPAVRL